MCISTSELIKMAQGAVHCNYCGIELNWSAGKGKTRSNSPTLDRKENGTKIDRDSIQILCHRCNSIKGNEFGQVLRNRLQAMLRNIPTDPKTVLEKEFIKYL